MEGFWSSLSKWFNEKTGSPLYFTYTGFFLAWNWKFFQIVFLENSSLFTSPRVEYIDEKLISPIHVPLRVANHITPEILKIIDWILGLGWHILPPVAFTWLVITYMPRVQEWALDKYLSSRFDRKKMFEKRQRQYNEWLLTLERSEEKTLEEIAEVKRRQVKQKEAIQKATTKEEGWLQEYEEMKKHSLFPSFNQLTNVIYTYGGKTSIWRNGRMERILDTDLLAYTHSAGIITIEKPGMSAERVELTEKGKFFVARFLLEQGDVTS